MFQNNVRTLITQVSITSALIRDKWMLTHIRSDASIKRRVSSSIPTTQAGVYSTDFLRPSSSSRSLRLFLPSFGARLVTDRQSIGTGLTVRRQSASKSRHIHPSAAILQMYRKFNLFAQILAKNSRRFSKRMSHRRPTNWSKTDFVWWKQWNCYGAKKLTSTMITEQGRHRLQYRNRRASSSHITNWKIGVMAS